MALLMIERRYSCMEDTHNGAYRRYLGTTNMIWIDAMQIMRTLLVLTRAPSPHPSIYLNPDPFSRLFNFDAKRGTWQSRNGRAGFRLIRPVESFEFDLPKIVP